MTEMLRTAGQINLHQILVGGIDDDPPPPVPVVAAHSEPADQLRLRLAVRGWAPPGRLLDGGPSKAAIDSALAAVAPDVETAAATRPGEWFLTVQARVRTLGANNVQVLIDAAQYLPEDDRQDPVQWAFQLALGRSKLDLGNASKPKLRALANVREWLGEQWSLPFDADHISAAIAAQTLDADLARMTAQPLVGDAHKRALKGLINFSTEPPSNWLSAVYVHATGGGGKTTTLAFLQRKLRERSPPRAVARIDFDEPAIDPANMITMNLSLFEQLATGIPSLGVGISALLPLLRRTASAQRASDTKRRSPLAGWTRREAAGRSLSMERVIAESASDQASLLGGFLSPQMLGGPLVVILDTAELVMARNVSAAAGITAWFQFLRDELEASDVRLIIAGRDPPEAEGNGSNPAGTDLLSRLSQIGATFGEPLALPGLVPAEAEELLSNCGIQDLDVRRKASQAVPGNPLLLRITAETLLKGDPKITEAIRSAHNASRIDQDSARAYLMRRIVAHIGDPFLRPYLLGAMVSPIITRGILTNVIMPVIDDIPEAEVPRSRVDRVFRSLGGVHWIGRMALDGKSFVFNRDLRALVLKLVAASPDDASSEMVLREAAFRFHSGRKTALDRALAIYHAGILGNSYHRPRLTPEVTRILRDVFEELPEDLREELTTNVAGQDKPSTGAQGGANASGSQTSSMSEEDWRLYLEGAGGKEGQGDQLVRDDRAEEALALYLGRPTRASGRPPTFVIQALADLGQWDSAEADVDMLFDDIDAALSRPDLKRLSPDLLSRIYWTLRLALLKGDGELTEQQIALLGRVTEITTGPGLATFPALVAVAEASSGRLVISPRMVRGVRGNEAESRIHLVRGEPVEMELNASIIAVSQNNWFERVRSSRALGDGSIVRWVQDRLNAIQDRPIASVNHALAEMRRPVAINWDGRDLEEGILLLRGQTVEFLRPLRETLANMYAYSDGRAILMEIVSEVLQRMTIQPAELQQGTFFDKLGANPRAWLTSFVSYADRSRLLPFLCRLIRENAGMAASIFPAARVAGSFLAWDHALCRGGTSDWFERP